MSDTAPVRLADYRPPACLIDAVHLTFRLDPDATIVTSRIHFRRNPESAEDTLRLHGEELELLSSKINGIPVDLNPDPKGIDLTIPAETFVWEAEVRTAPSNNTVLEGLYISNGLYCTQCEAEGFRRITFYPDRPDVMAPFTVRIESDQPVLLSNGNLIAEGDGWAEWHDPWPKPAYLFALVAGDLVALRDTFTTSEGRSVDLAIWTHERDIEKTAYAMDSLKRSMRWDEQVYGRAYDLDVFNIVAVDDFNAGAMENKGLNIFNASYVLASPETATDNDYLWIESVVAHEYFHNWTGNRITCRDWFQLSLKEGLTVFRDQQFTADMRSAPVKRIGDVIALRQRQFREDAGPLAHPVRPEEYHEINNFYTTTVYEKGAEVIRMLKNLVGDEGYADALGLYFDRHDGDAATVEDWLKVFEDTTGRDLTQFKRWYSQAGTPHLTITDDYSDNTYTLAVRQETKPTPGQPKKAPQVIPLAVGLLSRDGSEVVPTQVLELTEAQQTFHFDGIASKPVPSLLRDFSAPVTISAPLRPEDRALLFRHDTDPVNRWEAGRQITKDTIIALITDKSAPNPSYLDALGALATDETLDPAFRAFALALPSEDDTAQTLHDAGVVPDPTAIHVAHRRLQQVIGQHLTGQLSTLYDTMDVLGPYSPDAEAAGRRALRIAALGYLTKAEGPERARALFRAADNMTESLAALSALLSVDAGTAELATFHDRWTHERLVMDKWFSLQIARANPDVAASLAEELTRHPAFDPTNPNRFRAVFGGLFSNPAGFHHPSGAAYRLLTDWLLKMDGTSPRIAARTATALETWRRYDADRQQMIRDQLARLMAADDLSRDTREIAERLLGA